MCYTTAELARKGYTGYEKDAESSLEFARGPLLQHDTWKIHLRRSTNGLGLNSQPTDV